MDLGLPKLAYKAGWNRLLATIVVFFAACTLTCFAQAQNASPSANEIRILEIQGVVKVFPQGATGWTTAQTNQVLHPGDRLQAARNSRVALRWSDESIVSFGASSELEILPPNSADDQAGLHLLRGIISFFHRDKPGRIHIITHGAMAGVEGTEFAMAVDDADATTLSVIDGKVRFGNERATLLLTNDEQAVTEPGKAPHRTAGFIANNVLQWCFYYPAVLDPDELQLTSAEQDDLGKSLDAYRSGDLLAALADYPTNRPNASDREKVYHAALLLSVGEVAGAEAILASASDTSGRPARLGMALRQLIAAVKLQPSVLTAKPELASELLADSYFEQSRAVRETSLKNALQLARRATEVSPKFGFAWERLAELEFSFGRSADALKALDTSHTLSPRNAQAMALTGFILAAQGQPKQARQWFDRAIAADAALGNAWLGRGLVRIHNGDKRGGREDLLVAAALEPQRAELRSYLGKAYAVTGDDTRAARELTQAKKLDPNDPTAWLYSALLNQQDNQINDAIRDLEKSQELNNNRSVYRSQLLLDEDSAVRSANLAWIYQDDGMSDLSIREAGRAVSTDYANFSAHLFLANSYNQLRDPNWANLRYETPTSAESWIANLLAPTSAGWLSQGTAEQQPYTRLFDQNRIGIVSDTTYLARDYKGRAAITENGDAFGTYDKFSFNFGSSYQFDPGQRPNEDLDTRELDLDLKYQLTPQDSVFLSVQQVKRDNGDLNEYYNQADANNNIRYSEKQWPNLYAGFHHEWSPGVHTLFLTSYGSSDNIALTQGAQQWDAFYAGGIYQGVDIDIDNAYVRIFPTEYSAEHQQIWETPNHTTVVGARYFWGDINFQNIEWQPESFDAGNLIGDLGSFAGPDPTHYPVEIANQNFVNHFNHVTAYAYHDWRILDSLKLSAGLAYDYLEQPAVVDTIPFSTEEKSKNQVSPKGGIIWNPLTNTIIRAAYTRSLSGFLNDSSIRLEPTEVDGFNQAYRSIIPNTVVTPDFAVGDTSGSRLDTIDVSLEQKFDTGTYLALSGEILYSHLLKDVGAYFTDGDNINQAFPYPLPLRESLDYRERSLTFTADQLLGKQWSIGARYRISQANLNTSFLDMLPTLPFAADSSFTPRYNIESLLHTVTLHANWNHPSGLFSILEADWYHQNNWGFSSPEPGDDFWQFNVTAGYRFWHRRAEISGGVLNVGDQNYSLEPLNLYNEMARTRTFFVRVLINF